jgi:hypothetical protein
MKYCSDGCRSHKPNHIDKDIENLIARMLDEEPGSGVEKTLSASRGKKGDRRVLVSCDEIQTIFFEHENLDSEIEQNLSSQELGQRRAERRERVRRAARRAVVFGLLHEDHAAASSIGGASTKMADKITSAEPSLVRKCEAVVNGAVVEPSFAKGDWCVRWRS